MVEKNKFEIDSVPKTYNQAMQTQDSIQWQQAVFKELASIEANKIFSVHQELNFKVVVFYLKSNIQTNNAWLQTSCWF
jgi:hypothetical protein